MLETGEASTNAEDLVRNIKGDLSSDEIFVFTPNGDIKTLPSGAAVIDFAYAIHSAVGNRMTGAKVNGKIVPITYKLKTGEICEVLTSNQPGKGPSRDWLKVVTTGEARSKIRPGSRKSGGTRTSSRARLRWIESCGGTLSAWTASSTTPFAADRRAPALRFRGGFLRHRGLWRAGYQPYDARYQGRI